MDGKSKTNKGMVIMLVGAALLMIAAALAAHNAEENIEAGKAAQDTITVIYDWMDEKSTAEETDTSITEEENNAVTIDGYGYIGILEIPSLGLELPIIKEWSYPALKIAPARESGDAATGDLIIAGHNYSTHFGELKDLTAGDAVTFTDLSGTIYQYTVTEIVVLDGTAVEEMTSGDWDLTLYTCTYDSKSRVTVRCSLAE